MAGIPAVHWADDALQQRNADGLQVDGVSADYARSVVVYLGAREQEGAQCDMHVVNLVLGSKPCMQ